MLSLSKMRALPNWFIITIFFSILVTFSISGAMLQSFQSRKDPVLAKIQGEKFRATDFWEAYAELGINIKMGLFSENTLAALGVNQWQRNAMLYSRYRKFADPLNLKAVTWKYVKALRAAEVLNIRTSDAETSEAILSLFKTREAYDEFMNDSDRKKMMDMETLSKRAFEEGARNSGIEQPVSLPGWTQFRIALRVSCSMESCYSMPVNGDMVGVSITPVRFEGGHHLRFHPANDGN